MSDRVTIALRLEPQLHAEAKVAAIATGAKFMTAFLVEAIQARVEQVKLTPEYADAIGSLMAQAVAEVAALEEMAQDL